MMVWCVAVCMWNFAALAGASMFARVSDRAVAAWLRYRLASPLLASLFAKLAASSSLTCGRA